MHSRERERERDGQTDSQADRQFLTYFYKFSTEELRLATGTSTPVARKKTFLYVFYRFVYVSMKEYYIEGSLYTFLMFFKSVVHPVSVNIKNTQ